MSSAEERLSWYLSVNFAECVIGLSVCAIQLFMGLYMISLYVEAPPETRKRRLLYIVASFVITILFSTAEGIFAAAIYQTTFEASPGPENVDAGIAALGKVQTLLALSSLFADCAFRVGDIILLYRCYIVWFDYSWIVVLPSLLFLASTGIALRTYIPFSFNDERLHAADILLIVCLNVLITCLIALRLIRAQRRFTSALPNADHKAYLGIIGILVESAAPIAIIGIAVAVARLHGRTYQGYQAQGILKILFFVASILSPQLIIFRVATGASWADKTDTGVILSHPIQFTTTTKSTSDEENVTVE